MSAAIEPGMWVECVRDASDQCPLTPLRVGAVYQVAEVFRYLQYDALYLKGVDSPRGYNGFLADLFRPIYRPKAELIVSLLVPAPEAPIKTREPA